jgi:hypothetical protein
MKIGINLVGVSYNDGRVGRYRNYEDALGGFMTNVVNPLIAEGHEVFYYTFTYDSPKKEDILRTYTPIKSTFLDPNYNKMGGGDIISDDVVGIQMKMISLAYINSLEQLKGQELDLVISTRFDINFFKNPFKEYPYDFTKFNFLWREPEYTHLPIVNDTFVVFPYFMLNNVIDSINEMEFNPPHGVNVAMHNWYLPMVNQVGKENVQWVCDDFVNAISNNLYKLMRHE